MIKWFGSLFGIVGAIMLAMNNEYSMYGYIFFILSAILLTYIFRKDKPIFLQQGVFLIINIYGGFQWLV